MLRKKDVVLKPNIFHLLKQNIALHTFRHL